MVKSHYSFPILSIIIILFTQKQQRLLEWIAVFILLSFNGWRFQISSEQIGEGWAIYKHIRNQEQIADIELSQSQVCTLLSSIKMTNLCSPILCEAIHYYVSMPLLVLLDNEKFKGSLFIDHQMDFSYFKNISTTTLFSELYFIFKCSLQNIVRKWMDGFQSCQKML